MSADLTALCKKHTSSLRYFLQGAAHTDRQFYMPLDALNRVLNTHVGTRKDGVTPEFYHQVSTTNYMRTLLPSMIYPAETLTVMLLHDTHEDEAVDIDLIGDLYGDMVADACMRISKVRHYNGKSVKIEPDEYYGGMADCPITSLCKGADRINNQSTMRGVFTDEKQQRYLEETRTFILPMLKDARRHFPQQEMAYENIKAVLEIQQRMIGGEV